MSTAPTGFQAPKTDWKAADVVTPTALNRIEGNIAAVETGERTINPAQAPSGLVGTLRQWLDWFANRIKAITGEANWHDAPATTLKALLAKFHGTTGHKHTGEAGQGPALIHHQTFTESGTWTKPTGCKVVYVECVGGGGGGESGRSVRLSSTNATGGSAGGGGARICRFLSANILPEQVSVIIGAGGEGGPAVSGDSSACQPGTDGGYSEFGQFLRAYGGGKAIQNRGGHGGGSAGIGTPYIGTDLSQYGNAAGRSKQTSSDGGSAEFGGGAGATSSTRGGGSLCAGGGGGGGGRTDSKGDTYLAGSGGASGSWRAGEGGEGGASGGGYGGDGADGDGNLCGHGGGGGGVRIDKVDGHAGNGGKGGAPGGGGGGGGGRGYSDSALRMSGKGGDGGRGEVRIWAW